MKTRTTFALLVFGMATLSAQSAFADGAKCAALASASFGSEVKIESATLVSANAQVPEHCDVRGAIWPEAKFAVKLPTNWNNRFYMVGGGGYAGQLSLGPMNAGLQKGYATATTDTGHDAAKEPLGAFAERRADNPNADRKKLDYAYLAVHNTAVLAKQIIKSYYGSDAKYSYWVGCSTGGRQGLMEAQRYPEDFDGYLIGAPVLKQSHEGMRGIWNAQAVSTGPGAGAYDKLPLLAEAVYKKCDDVDGLQDWLITDPRQCRFDPLKDLPKCEGDVEGKNCFTTAQLEGLRKAYDGVRNSKGVLLYPGQPLGAEDYYESVMKKMGARQTKEFYRLYMIPGMFHCAGGVGCDRADWFTPLVEWVEKGVAPGAIRSSRLEKGETVRTRPQCLYPEVARYNGQGDINRAQNFTCTSR